MKPKDFLERELTIGSRVVFMQKFYRNLVVGHIIKLTDKMCLIEHEKLNIGGTQTRQFHDQVVVVEG